MTAPKVLSAAALGPRTIEIVFDQPMNMTGEIANRTSYTFSPSIPAYNQSVLSSPNTVSIRITLAVNMLHGAAYTVEVASTLDNAAHEAMDADFLSANFIGIGDAPTLTNTVALNATTIRATFSEPMDVGSISSIARYAISSSSTSQLVTISALAPIDGGGELFNQVDITISSKMTDGGLHRLAINGMLDAAGNQQLSGEYFDFVGIAIQPRVLSASLSSVDELLTIAFDSALQNLDSIGAYAIHSQLGAPPIYYGDITPASDRKSAKLKISTPLDGASYLIVASGVGLVDDFGNTIDPSHNAAIFIGVSTPPTLTNAIAVGVNRLDLTFDRPIRDSAEVRDVAHYGIPGLTVVKVLSVESNIIKLSTTDQVSGTLYTLTIT
jgi:hypothetical protein